MFTECVRKKLNWKKKESPWQVYSFRLILSKTTYCILISYSLCVLVNFVTVIRKLNLLE